MLTARSLNLLGHAQSSQDFQGPKPNSRSALLLLIVLTSAGAAQSIAPVSTAAYHDPHANDGRVHSIRWCTHCERWNCSGCGQNCGCPQTCQPNALPRVVTPNYPHYSPQASPPSFDSRVPTFPDGSSEDESQLPPIVDAPQDLTVPDNDRDQTPAQSTPPNQDSANTGRPAANDLAGFAGNYGSGAGLQGTPNMIGDNFGGGPTVSIFRNTVPFALQATGQTGSQFAGNANAFIAFESSAVDGNVTHDDFFSMGAGRDEIGGPGADTFNITEPVPPSDAPTSPGAAFVFDGGVATNPTGTFNDGDVWDVNYSFSRTIQLVIPEPSSGGLVVGRLKIAENTSPMPRNRVFFNYSLFDNVPLANRGVTVNRFIPGFERTSSDGQASIEFRAPFAATVSSTVVVDSNDQLRDLQWGNLMVAVKRLLAIGSQGAISIGLAATVPTAEDLTVALNDGTPLTRIANQSVHLMPFLGWMHMPNDRFFAQGFFQVDTDVNGNTAYVNPRGNGLVSVGRTQASTFMYIDAGVGYWWYRNPMSQSRITGIAPTLELHFNRSLQTSDTIRSNGFQIGGGRTDIEQLNGLAGCA
ncbi:MAG: hypothetical protein O2931_14445, partial [Planctomycetota bacterium]|nr:hypothetical protein [Planctomycetota bacterium]